MKPVFFCLLFSLLLGTATAQTDGSANTYSADTESPEALLAALYDVISGPVGQARDWDRFRHMFLPESFLAVVASSSEGTRFVRMTPEEYIQRSGNSLVEVGFYEVPIHNVWERYGPLVHVFSTYEGRKGGPDGELYVRGINSIQLVQVGNRWYVLSVVWHPATATEPIPKAYLPK